jgi:hypothetical protein
MGSLPVKYSFWTSITKSGRCGFSVIKLIVGQHGCWERRFERALIRLR